MEIIHMADIIPLMGIPGPTYGRSSYNISCPCCDENPKKKHLNINLVKDVFRCPRCGFSGGVFDLYAYYTGIDRKYVRKAILERLNRSDKNNYNINSQQKRTVFEEIECPITDIDARHETYTALIKKLSLASDHRENLFSRGLSDEQIEKLEYRTTPVVGLETISKQLQEEGYYLSGVPGFYHTEKGSWSFIRESRGIIVPVRDAQKRIQGLQIRRDKVDKRKFRWVSSVGKKDGCKAEGWTHVVGKPSKKILLTEGPMKADIIHALSGNTVIAVPGVNALTHLELTLDTLKEQGTEHIMTAFDMDFLTNPHVQKGYEALISMLDQKGFRFGSFMWDSNYKGLDDYIWHKKQEKYIQ